ncbi:unnamed protein product [Mytilus coruscus]|uniref:Uncharacterized protein n=1 Tax=Mytilus coruscus TaxID=42192 RepID=A0A6J8A0E7_MYTCO|nr:unnamed protein product [Mytilus coruscus]
MSIQSTLDIHSNLARDTTTPTPEAASQHCKRTYYQIQEWTNDSRYVQSNRLGMGSTRCITLSNQNDVASGSREVIACNKMKITAKECKAKCGNKKETKQVLTDATHPSSHEKSYRNNIQNMFSMKRKLVDLKHSLANRSRAEVKLLKSNKILNNSAKNAETSMKAMQKCLQNEKVRIKYINNITRMEKKRTIEKCKYWENIAQKTRYIKDHLQAKHETEVKILQDQILNMRQEKKANKHEINKTKDELHFVLDNLNEKKTKKTGRLDCIGT